MKFKGRCLLSIIYESKKFSLIRKDRVRVISMGNDIKFTGIHQWSRSNKAYGDKNKSFVLSGFSILEKYRKTLEKY